jgi:hypothetical protein
VCVSQSASPHCLKGVRFQSFEESGVGLFHEKDRWVSIGKVRSGLRFTTTVPSNNTWKGR